VHAEVELLAGLEVAVRERPHVDAGRGGPPQRPAHHDHRLLDLEP
jgi:hypothetical protein